MAENPGASQGRRIAVLSEPADRDHAIIYAYTAHQWGVPQAESYLDFLDEVMLRLADQPEMALLVPRKKITRVYTARWAGARDGHRIFFRETEDGILVLRILHTKMNWRDHLGRID